MAREIDRKLCLTAAAFGLVTRKDLAAAFRRVNPSTSFDLDRAHKWLQGRAQPRDSRLYDDWSALLAIGRPGAWIAACTIEDFIDALAAEGPLDREALLRQADLFGGGVQDGQAPCFVGRYVAYSHAWAPYFRDQLIRGELTIEAERTRSRPFARYTEYLPTTTVRLEGPVTHQDRGLYLDLRGPNVTPLQFCLFAPVPPASLLGGILCGLTLLSSEVQVSATRIVLARLPEGARGLRAGEHYLPPDTSLAADLSRIGLPISDTAAVDAALRAFLGGGGGGGLDQIRLSDFRPLAELFDGEWFAATGRCA
ncbi:MAG: hypothetical protein U1E52_05125 [Geminicoccaceae bacterium]